MHGEISVESAPGRGTVIRVLLPLQEGQPAEPAVAPAALPRGRGERILLVDDEEGVRSVGAKILDSLGYQVTPVDRAARAIAAVREAPRDFQLILTDQTMPEMAGVELARQLSRMAPGIPIVLMTGNLGRDMEVQAREAGVIRVLSKPFRRAEMARAVRQALDAAADARA
jgi:CheY-like chemotaxis protein